MFVQLNCMPFSLAPASNADALEKKWMDGIKSYIRDMPLAAMH